MKLKFNLATIIFGAMGGAGIGFLIWVFVVTL